MDRYFKNDCVGMEDTVIEDTDKVQEMIRGSAEILMKDLEQKLETDNTEDTSVYTGTTGIGLLYWHLYTLRPSQKHLIEKATSIVENACKKLGRKGKYVSFLGGDAGPLALGVVIGKDTGNLNLRKTCLEGLMQMGDSVLNTLDPSSPNELLFGRAGYLYSLLFVNKHLHECVDTTFIKKVVNVLIEEGRRAKLDYLYYEWHQKCYLGAAHGIAGIMYILLLAQTYMTSSQLDLVQKTVDWLLSLRFPEGNLPSSLGSKDDRLVHFCHGSPGAIHVFIEAHKVFGDQAYFDAALASGEVVWRRGLLRKGYSLCHGVGGNAYALMALYHLTHEEKYLKRAYVFAKWCFEYGRKADHPPDRPLSLFEGQAGVVYMLNDFGWNPLPRFPAFQL